LQGQYEAEAQMTHAEQPLDDALLAAAMHWHAATARADCDWQGFTEWLEASPRHRAAYDDVALLDERIARHADALREPVVTPVRIQSSRSWAVAGVALVALLAYRVLPDWFAGNPRSFTAQAAAESVVLAGGVQVVLAPGSSLAVAGRHDERLALQGSAWFDVPHDPRRELVIAAGDFQLRDIGTRFEVVSGGAAGGALLKVAVAEGELGVLLPGSHEPVPLHAGQQLLVAGDPPIAEYGEVAVADVAGWREGRLMFRNEPLSLVALQVARHAGVVITVDPAVARRRFSGVLAIGDGSQLVEQLARIMDLRVERTGNAVHLLPAGGQPAGR
jgi:transmembrane sensor